MPNDSEWPFPPAEREMPLPIGPWQVAGERSYSMRRQWYLQRQNKNTKWPYGMEPLMTTKGNRRLFLSQEAAETEAARLNAASGVRASATSDREPS